MEINMEGITKENKPDPLRNIDKDNMRGILITLKKRTQIPIYNKNYDFVALGYYDGMKVSTVNKWTDFLPSKIESNHGELELDDDSLDIYTIKACEPLSLKKKMKCMGFNYDIWDKPDNKFDVQYPLAACTMIHLSEECVAANSIDDILEVISKEIVNNVTEMKEINCGLYFSVGYSDIIIMFRTNDFEHVNCVLKGINKSEIKNRKIISDSYTITGFKNRIFTSFEDVKKAVQGKEYKCFSVSFSLRENIIVDEFISFIERKTKELCDKIGIQYKDNITVEKSFSVFGSVDVIIEFNLPVYAFMALYMAEDEIFNAPFCINYNLRQKATIHSTVMIPSKSNGAEKDFADSLDTGEGNYKNDKKNEEYINDLGDFTKFTHRHGITHRNVVAIKQLLKSYYNLIASRHGFELREIIGKAFNAFFSDISICMKEIDDLSLKFQKDSQPNDEDVEVRLHYARKISDLLKSIEFFRKYVGTYLSDLSRSDRSFIEGRTMTHPSIGSLTKLLFCYNKFVNNLVNDIETNNYNDYVFVIVSGGCDCTEVNELFGHMRSSDQYKHLYIITLPEICLFDIRGTLLGLAHECFHCIGERCRDIRLKKVLESLNKYIAKTISDIVVKEIVPNIKLNDDKRADIIAGICAIKESLHKELIDNLISLSNIMVDGMEITSESQLNCDNSIYSISKIMNVIMSCNFDYLYEQDDTFYDYTYNAVLEAMKEIYEYLLSDKDICNIQNRIEISALKSEILYYRSNEQTKFQSQNVCKTILNRLFIAFRAPEYLKTLEAVESLDESKISGEADRNENMTHKISSYGFFSYDYMTHILVDTMCECFADCMAIKMLGADISDFLLMFIYQDWNIEKAFPCNTATILRIGVDISLMFGGVGKLSEDHENSIRQAFRNYDANSLVGYKNEDRNENITEDILISRINSILERFQNYGEIGDSITDYINTCFEYNSFKNEYRDMYEEWLDVNELENQSLYKFIDTWRDYAEEKDAET